MERSRDIKDMLKDANILFLIHCSTEKGKKQEG